MTKAEYIEDRFDIQGLVDIGFFQMDDPDDFRYIASLTDYERIEKRICTFFALKQIHEYDLIPYEKPAPPREWLDKTKLYVGHN